MANALIQRSFWGIPELRILEQPTTKPKRARKLVGSVLNLGAGRQSSAIAEMIVEGDLPPVDVVVFADTGDEPSWVYEQIWYLAGRLNSVNIPLQVVMKQDFNGGIVESAKIYLGRYASMPLFTLDAEGKQGILRRQCTNEWKVQPTQDYLRNWLEAQGYVSRTKNNTRRVRSDVYIEMWYGIGLDELYRQKKRGTGWQHAIYPLIELKLKTSDALQYLQEKGLRIPRKSSCRVCPYHDDGYWLDLKENYPSDFEHACVFDDFIRTPHGKRAIGHGHLRDTLYLHRSLTPLREVDFRDQIDTKRRGKISPLQNELIFGATCSSDGAFSCFS